MKQEIIDLLLLKGPIESRQEKLIGGITKDNAGELHLTFTTPEYEKEFHSRLTTIISEPQLIRGGEKKTDGTTGATQFVSTGTAIKSDDPRFMQILATAIAFHNLRSDDEKLIGRYK